jgi:hypothetical protein
MKKVVLSLAFVAAVLVSCNKKADGTEGIADSTNVDSTSVVANDTTAVKEDTTTVKTDSVTKTEEVKKEEVKKN